MTFLKNFTKSTILLFSKHFNLQSGGRLPGVKRENKTETTGFFAYNFSALKKAGSTEFFRLTAQPYRARSSQCGRLYI
jgi:hypothetical protein